MPKGNYQQFIDWVESQVMDDDIQYDLDTFFDINDVDKIKNEVIKKSRNKATQLNENQLNALEDNWDAILRNKKVPDWENEVSGNQKLGIDELQKLFDKSGLDNTQRTRVALQLKEKSKERGSSMSRQEILDLGVLNVSLRKFVGGTGLSETQARDTLLREGFNIDERDIIRK